MAVLRMWVSNLFLLSSRGWYEIFGHVTDKNEPRRRLARRTKRPGWRVPTFRPTPLLDRTEKGIESIRVCARDCWDMQLNREPSVTFILCFSHVHSSFPCSTRPTAVSRVVHQITSTGPSENVDGAEWLIAGPPADGAFWGFRLLSVAMRSTLLT